MSCNMIRRMTTLFLFCLLLGAAESVRATTVSSTFDDGTLEGWTKGPSFNGQLFVDPGVGNPGGSLAFTDTAPAGGGLYAKAPPSLTGDLTGFVGVSWDRFVPNYDANTKNTGAVVLVGGPNSTAFLHASPLEELDTWAHRFVPFQVGFWQQVSIGQLGATGADSFQAVIQDVDALYMAGDTSNLASGVLEIRLDNIELSMVPEPASSSAMALGVCGLALVRFQRRR